MTPQWEPEIVVDERLARRLIDEQFEELCGATIQRIGNGWDNVAYLVGERYVFRFPQRTIAAPLIEHEIAALPTINAALPVATPRVTFVGYANDDYPWSFAGYPILRGRPACTRELTDDERAQFAHDLGHALRALHDCDPESLQKQGVPNDEIGRLSPEKLRLDEEPLRGPLRLVHGDLYSRHFLIDDGGRLAGIIDWGDVHCGHIAVDIQALYLMVPKRYHAHFFDAYGAIDDRTRRFARARAEHMIRRTADYATTIGDVALERSAAIASDFLRED